MEKVMTAANSKKEEWALDSPCQRLRKSIRTVWRISILMLWCKGLKVFLHLFEKFSIKSKEIKLQKPHKDNYRVSNLEAKTNLPKQFNSCYPDRQNRLDHKGAGLQRINQTTVHLSLVVRAYKYNLLKLPHVKLKSLSLSNTCSRDIKYLGPNPFFSVTL